MVRLPTLVLALLAAVGCAPRALPPAPFPPVAGAAALAPALIPRVEHLYARDRGDGLVMCSATAVGPATALTARHCVGEAGTNAVLLGLDGVPRWTLANPSATEDRAELLLLEGPPFGSWADIGDPPAPGAPGWVAGFGCSRGKQLAIRATRYLARSTTLDPSEQHFDDWRGLACHGDSGGGMFDRAGRLVGVNSRIGVGDFNAGHVYTAPAR